MRSLGAVSRQTSRQSKQSGNNAVSIDNIGGIRRLSSNNRTARPANNVSKRQHSLTLIFKFIGLCNFRNFSLNAANRSAGGCAAASGRRLCDFIGNFSRTILISNVESSAAFFQLFECVRIRHVRPFAFSLPHCASPDFARFCNIIIINIVS